MSPKKSEEGFTMVPCIDLSRQSNSPRPSRSVSKRFALIAFILLACMLPSALWAQAKASDAKSSVSTTGSWAAPVNFCTYPCLVGGSAAVMNNGQVLLYYYPGSLSHSLGSQAVMFNPTTGVVTNVSLPWAGDIFCSGLSVLYTGDVLVTGGNVQGTCPRGGCGTPNANIFESDTVSWEAGSPMIWPRWYPSSIELSDGTLLEISGSDPTGKVIQTELETYNYANDGWVALPSSANMPSDVLQPYPRMSLLPSGKLLMSAPSPHSYTFDPVANTWTSVGNLNFGYRYFAPHVLLPGLEKVMVAGGTLSHLNGGGDATNTVEMIDMSQPTPAWSYIAPMNFARYNENLVLLPDGTVLAVGGGGGGGAYTNPVLAAEVYNPTANTWTTLASQTVQRTYHSTAVLLPDGRVLSAGSDNSQPTQVTYEIFSPPYLFNGPRPIIKSAPTSLTYGQKFTISSPNAGGVTRVALIHPGATTHADDFDQRYVDLTFTHSAGALQVTAPANGNYAPPGYYMLVIVSSSGIPSVMPFVNLQAAGTATKVARRH
jgi:hypothetical protein